MHHVRKVKMNGIAALVVAGIAAVLGASCIAAQPPSAFEVVSIKRNLTDGDRPMRTSLTAGRFVYPNTTVIGLIRTAFGIKSFQISQGWPGWLSTERYDIVGTIKSAETISLAQLRPMLQRMLEDRFRLKIHRETSEMPVYALVVTRSGPKIRVNTGADGLQQRISGEAGMLQMKCVKVSMAYFANALESQFESQFGRKVVDRTGLEGDYDITVSWAMDQSGDSPGPSIFTAVQEQLGLKLEAEKDLVESIRIDSVDRPSKN